MIKILYGTDQFLISEHLSHLYARYMDETDFEEFTSENQITIADLTAALKQIPFINPYYTVTVHLNKAQWGRLKDYLPITSPMTLEIIILPFTPQEEDLRKFTDVELIDCYMPKGRQLTMWAKKQSKQFGLDLQTSDLKDLSSSFSSLKEINDTFKLLSYLNTFQQHCYLKDVLNSKTKFSWNLFVALVRKSKKEFFTIFAENYYQNLDLSGPQFLAKTVGGIIFCLNAWRNDSLPDWVEAKVEPFNDAKNNIIAKLHCSLMIAVIEARSKDSLIPGLNQIMTIFS